MNIYSEIVRETVQLSVSPEKARSQIRNQVEGIQLVRADNGRYRILTQGGVHLGSISEIELQNGETGSELHFQPTMVGTVLRNVTTKIWEIQDAVSDLET